MNLDEAREVAYDWHGGMWSPLYSFASTGKVHGTDHRINLLREIDDIRQWAGSSAEAERIQALAAFVAVA